MGAIRPPRHVKLVVGMLSGDVDLLAESARRLRKHFGDVDLRSDVWPFTTTDYYEAELGDDVKRQFVSFGELIAPDRLSEIKRTTNDLEAAIAEDLALPPGSRPVNLDPGYVTLSKFVLATTKDYSHRVYLSHGIYAEMTLRYESGGWSPWPWTYPDYAAATYRPFFDAVRERLKEQYRAQLDG